MSSAEHLKAFVSERLTAAAEEIFGVFKRTILEYEEEIHRHRRLLDHVLKPDVQLHRIDLPQQPVHQEEDFLPNQRLFTQERNSSLDQEDPEPPQIKEEQEEVCSSQEEEQLVLKQETDSFMLPPVDEKNDHGEAQTLDMNRNETEEESVVNVSVTSSHPATIYTSNPKRKRRRSFKCDICGKDFTSNFHLQRHVRVHTDLPQQLVHQEEDFLPNQRLFTQERNSSLDQEDPEPPQIKEEQEELCSSQEEEQLVLKQETDSFMLPPVDEKNDHGEAQTLDMNRNETEEESVVNVSVISSHPATIYTSNPKRKRRRSFQCGICGKEFNSNFNLQRHMRVHTGEKNHYCKVCGKGFCDVSTLKRHTMIHTGEKPFTCKTCGTAFRYSSQLTVHVRKYHT